MNKYSLIVLAFLFTFLTTCSKNGNDNSNDNPLVGTSDKSGNLLATGDSANDLLANTNFSKLQIEIAYVTNFRPTNEAMTMFETFLNERTFKEEIEFIYKELPSPGEEKLTLNEIDDLEKENRTAYNNGETIAVYIFFADAPSVDDDEGQGLVTLGAVYRNTSMVIYESTIRNLANLNSSVSISEVEITTLNHEFGHLFGLVNVGTPPVNPNHEDNGNMHCNVEGCLMRAELQFGGSNAAKSLKENKLKAGCKISGKSVLQLLGSSILAKNGTQSLDPECILDLQSNGGR